MEHDEENIRGFVPEWNGNREKPEADQILAELVPMTGGELRAAQRASIGKDGTVNIKSAEAAIKKIIQGRVVRLTNCVDILGNTITDGPSLWERGEQSLIDEMYSGITEISTLSEGARKK